MEESAASVTDSDIPAGKPVAPLLGGLGAWSFKVSTKSARAQQFFDQGIRMVYAFNHAEAVRAFQEAARLDPRSRMAPWGEALALGPNINAPLTADGHAQAFAAIQKAVKLRGNASAKEQALIEALSLRYTADTQAPRAVRQGVRRCDEACRRRSFRRTATSSTLYAAAVMDTMPWNYWEKDGSPRPGTEDVIKTLEKVIAEHPEQPGAHHFYIHMVEASKNPRSRRAQRRRARGSDAGRRSHGAHAVAHLPARRPLRRRVGVERARDRGGRGLSGAVSGAGDVSGRCYPHNTHFLWFASTFEGRSAQAIEMARKTAEKVPHHVSAHAGSMHDLPIVPLYAYVRFGKWTDILTTPQPAPSNDYAQAIWHYARAMAFLARDQVERAKAKRRRSTRSRSATCSRRR